MIHAILDNYATQKYPEVRTWLAAHPRWTCNFTLTAAPWLNAVEGFFAKLTIHRVKRCVFRSVVELQEAINRFVEETNANPRLFSCTANPDHVLAAIQRVKRVLESIHKHQGEMDENWTFRRQCSAGTRGCADSGNDH
jgi:hypothetical protein